MPDAKTSNRTSKLFDWLNRVLVDAELPPNAFKVAFEIGQHFNHRHGGAAWPSSLTIAKHIGVDEATVIRAVRQLRERGHLTVEPGRAGRGHPNRYRMSKPVKPAPVQVLKPPRKPALVSLKPAPAQENLLEPSKETLSAFPEREREREQTLADAPGAPAPDGARPLEGEVIPPDHFGELLAVWSVRPWGENDTEACLAFAFACREADPADIIASARRWVAAADAPRFLPPLTKWFDKGLWKKSPPKRRRGQRDAPSLGEMLAAKYGGRS